ncbi:hypothetical protein [Pedobacter sp. SYSU D00535]|uniref:hypothetical protein n=1 Tax=Pedobacter sp. SYSU D00535 TaxID=2810308 RepID=UPI001A95F3B1|nr:hypothetical protein [Pedobacter sp. SYSU D00535]
MKKPLLYHVLIAPFLFILFSALSSTAQTQDSLLKAHQFKAGLKLLGAGASYERKLSASATVYIESSVNYMAGSALYMRYSYVDPAKSSYDFYDGSGYVKTAFENKNTYSWVPAISSELRHYYNIKKRTARKKNVSNNSFDFVGLGASYMFDAKTNVEGLKHNSFFAGYGTWGIQKSVWDVFSFEFNLGPGIRYTPALDKSAEFYINANLKFDLVIK